MSNRVKNLDKITKELLTHISAWEESNGPFLYGVCQVVSFFSFLYVVKCIKKQPKIHFISCVIFMLFFVVDQFRVIATVIELCCRMSIT